VRADPVEKSEVVADGTRGITARPCRPRRRR